MSLVHRPCFSPPIGAPDVSVDVGGETEGIFVATSAEAPSVDVAGEFIVLLRSSVVHLQGGTSIERIQCSLSLTNICFNFRLFGILRADSFVVSGCEGVVDEVRRALISVVLSIVTTSL